MKKSTKKTVKKPLIIGLIGAGAAALAVGLGKAFKSMKASAKAQEERKAAAEARTEESDN